MPGFESEHIKLDNNIAVLNSRKGNWDAVFKLITPPERIRSNDGSEANKSAFLA